MDLDDELQKIEKSRQARFTLSGVIAAKNPESARKTHNSLQKICATIIDAYRVANDGTKSNAEKRKAILAVTDLTPEIDWLVEFTRQETEFCKFYSDIVGKMEKLTKTVENEVKMLKADFSVLEREPENFPDVFDNLLHLLENMTEFMKQGHAAEVCRTIETGKNSYMEAYNLLHLEVKSNLVPQAQLCSQRCNDFQKSTSNLVKIQEGSNEDLQGRVENAERLLVRTIPNFILATKDYFVHNNDPQLKEAQKHAHDDLVGCLDELNKILERVKVKYTNTFDEDMVRANVNLSPLEKHVREAMQAVAKLRTIPPDYPEAEKHILQEAVPKTTKAALAEFDNYHATPEEKQEFVRCIKQARDGPVADFFQAQDALGNLVEKMGTSHFNPPTIHIEVPAQTIEEDHGDLLEAAKALCASMKNLSITLDD